MLGSRWLQIAVTACIGTLSMADTAIAKEVLSNEEKQSINKLIEEYILQNPEVIIQSIEGMRERERLQVEQETKTNLVALAEDIFHNPSDPVAGNPDGDVTVVEFLDYRCGYCKSFFTSINAIIPDDENVRVVFEELPILGPSSERAARVALAASRQNLYLEFHTAIMSMRGGFNEKRMFAMAEEIGIDMSQLRQDMELSEGQSTLDNAREPARKLSITGTPAIIVGSNIVRGAIDKDRLSAMISEAREE